MLKNNSIYFLGICVNFSFKIGKLELEVVDMVILGTGICFQGQPLTYLIGKLKQEE